MFELETKKDKPMKKTLLAAIALLFSTTLARAEIVAQFTNDVENREPVGLVEVVTKDNDERVTYYTIVLEHADETVTHVWKNGDVEIYRKDYNIGGPRWRVWSSVSVEHFEAGDKVTVEVVDADGKVLQTDTIEVK